MAGRQAGNFKGNRNSWEVKYDLIGPALVRVTSHQVGSYGEVWRIEKTAPVRLTVSGKVYARFGSDEGLPDPKKDKRDASIKKAEAGDAFAMGEVGQWYLEWSEGLAVDHAKGMGFLRKAADAGNPWAAVQIARAYRAATGVPVDKAEAVRLMRIVAQGKCPARSRRCAGRRRASPRTGWSVSRTVDVAPDHTLEPGVVPSRLPGQAPWQSEIRCPVMARRIVTLTPRVPEDLEPELEAAPWKVFASRPDLAPSVEAKPAPETMRFSLRALKALDQHDVAALVLAHDEGRVVFEIEEFDDGVTAHSQFM